MELKVIEVAKVKEHELNPRTTIEEQFQRLLFDLRHSKEATGEYVIKSAIWVKQSGEDYLLIDGHHRIRAYKELGITECPAIVVENYSEWDMMMDLITMNKPIAYLDAYKLNEVVQKLKAKGWDDDYLTKRLGYQAGEMKNLTDFIANEHQMGERKPSEKIPHTDLKSFTVNLTSAEQDEVEGVLKGVIGSDPDMSKGRALELICADYLSGV